MKISNSKNIEQITKLRRERNQISKQIKETQKQIRNKNIDKIIHKINTAQNDKKMYEATKTLYKSERKENMFVYDKEGKCITNEKKVNGLIKEHFSQSLYDDKIPEVQSFRGEPRALNEPITAQEVSTVINHLSNNKAPGEDQIQVEMIKYGPPMLIQNICRILNEIFEKHFDQVNINKSILIPAQKINKTKGPITHLRAINLLNTIRKVLSGITLKRISRKVDGYLSKSQAAYRTGRSTTDIIWAQKFIIAKVQIYKGLEIFNTGIDMSAAFDTILRHKLINELETILNEDEMRLTQLLLSNTTISIQTGNTKSEQFNTNIGSPQGDGLSGTFFNVMFEAALRKVRAQVNAVIPTIEHSYVKRSNLPDELIYADDCDFENDDPEINKKINEIVASTLKLDNLKVNESKTEHIIFRREKKRGDEKWRVAKKLGSLLGDSEDVTRRKQLSYAALNKIKQMWSGRKKVNIHRRIKVYNTLVKSVLIYNSCTWGITNKEMESLDAHHRKQLRQIWKRRNMRNNEVYQLSKVRPISEEIREARWRMFGHSLRLHRDTPAQKAMEYYFTPELKLKKYKGQRRITLPIILNKDLKEANKKHIGNLELTKLETLDDLKKARSIAEDRLQWKKLSKVVCNIT